MEAAAEAVSTTAVVLPVLEELEEEAIKGLLLPVERWVLAAEPEIQEALLLELKSISGMAATEVAAVVLRTVLQAPTTEQVAMATLEAEVAAAVAQKQEAPAEAEDQAALELCESRCSDVLPIDAQLVFKVVETAQSSSQHRQACPVQSVLRVRHECP